MPTAIVLDCEGLSQLVRRTPGLAGWLAAAGARPRTGQARFDVAVSRVNVVPPAEAIARHASRLLATAGLHGHEHALDALAAATALSSPSPSPVTVLTSDSEDGPLDAVRPRRKGHAGGGVFCSPGSGYWLHVPARAGSVASSVSEERTAEGRGPWTAAGWTEAPGRRCGWPVW